MPASYLLYLSNQSCAIVVHPPENETRPLPAQLNHQLPSNEELAAAFMTTLTLDQYTEILKKDDIRLAEEKKKEHEKKEKHSANKAKGAIAAWDKKKAAEDEKKNAAEAGKMSDEELAALASTSAKVAGRKRKTLLRPTKKRATTSKKAAAKSRKKYDDSDEDTDFNDSDDEPPPPKKRATAKKTTAKKTKKARDDYSDIEFMGKSQASSKPAARTGRTARATAKKPTYTYNSDDDEPAARGKKKSSPSTLPLSKKTYYKCDKCTNYAVSGGLCIKHGGKRKKCPKKKCEFEGCTRNARGKEGVCVKHGALTS